MSQWASDMKLGTLKTVFALHCHEATELASDALDGPLSASERWGLRLHTLICGPCRRFLGQLRTMRQLARSVPQAWQAKSTSAVARLSAERRRQIKQLLADAGASE